MGSFDRFEDVNCDMKIEHVPKSQSPQQCRLEEGFAIYAYVCCRGRRINDMRRSELSRKDCAWLVRVGSAAAMNGRQALQ